MAVKKTQRRKSYRRKTQRRKTQRKRRVINNNNKTRHKYKIKGGRGLERGH